MPSLIRSKKTVKNNLKCDKKHTAAIIVNNKTVQLGDYPNEADATTAYDLAAIEYFGKEVAILKCPEKDYTNMSLKKWRIEKSTNYVPETKAISNNPVKKILITEVVPPTDYVTAKNMCVKDMAKICNYSRSQMHNLIRDGFFPKPLYTKKGRPYFNEELQRLCLQVISSREGVNGEPMMVYTKRKR